jgi:hypothetical protein
MKRLDSRIFEYLKKHPKVDISPQAIRNEISKIRAENPGITLNAAAATLAKKRGFRIMRFLSEEDKQSLQFLRKPVNTVIAEGPKRIKVKTVSPSFGEEFIKDANKNASLYPYVYILENSLRSLIMKILGTESNWWEKKVSKGVRQSSNLLYRPLRTF